MRLFEETHKATRTLADSTYSDTDDDPSKGSDAEAKSPAWLFPTTGQQANIPDLARQSKSTNNGNPNFAQAREIKNA